MIRKWDIKDEQLQRRCVNELLARIDEQAGSEFGVIAAQEMIDIVAKYVGPTAYNMAIEDVKKTLQVKLSDLEVELDILKSPY